jgi:uncharacterized membrane protein YphA (DoxX/SURF4 family)
MFQSLRISHLVLRIGLAVVFLWFGADKFIHPEHWINAWVPGYVQGLVESIGMSSRDLVFLGGIFEILAAISLFSGFFIRFFASAAVILLVLTVLVNGSYEMLIWNTGIVGGLLALALWPERTGW